MLKLEPYLNFPGTCEEALSFYAGVFGGEIISIHRFEGSPMESQLPPDYKNKIMHASFKAPGVELMGSDAMPGGDDAKGSRITLSLGGDDPAEGKRVFEALAAGGTVTMPLSEQFWGSLFGMLTDKYGIDWMVNVEKG